MTSLYDLSGKVAVVTGASSGLGVAFVTALAEAGADIVIGARRFDRLTQTARRVEATGRRAVAVQTDVTDPDSCQRLVDRAVSDLGAVDILVNNAGVGTAVPALRESPLEFERVISINLAGAYWMSQACARVMTPGSAIVNVGSILGIITAGLPQAAYSASKAGLHGLTRDLAQQWGARRGIRVNAVAPGFFPSEMTGQYPAGYLRTQMDRIPLGRIGEPTEVAAAVVFLASPAAGYVHGHVLVVDGGASIA